MYIYLKNNNMSYDALINEIFYLHNKIRNNPKFFIPYLQSQLNKYLGLTYFRNDTLNKEILLETKEGASAVLEAIEFLNKAEAIQPLILNQNISLSAQMYSSNIEKNGPYEKNCSYGDNAYDRIKSIFNINNIIIGESLVFNSYTAEDIIYNCIVSDGNADRTSRKNVFNSDYREIGIGVSKHNEFGNCIVIDYVGSFGTKESKTINWNNHEDNKLEYNEANFINEEHNINFSDDKRFKSKLNDLDNFDEIEDDEGPESAIGVQIIFEQVKINERNYIKQIKIYHNDEGPIETISKIFEK